MNKLRLYKEIYTKKEVFDIIAQALELAAEKDDLDYDEVEQGENNYIWLKEYPEVNKQSICDVINLIE